MRKLLITAATAAVVVGTAGTALAVTGGSSPSNTISGCLTSSRTVVNVHPGRASVRCATGQTHIKWNVTGPAGAKGDTGAPGPSGVVSTSTTDLGAVASVPTGGGFFANSTEVGTILLKAGTYLLNVNAKATPPAGGTGAVEVFPQFFVYNQVKNAAFTGDLFNIGSGALQSGVNANIDSYFSGSGEVTLSVATTLHIYAFGYDSDRSAGSYVLDDLSVTATQLHAG